MLIVDQIKITDALIQQRLNFKDLERRSGLASSTISRLALKGGNIRLDTLGRIADALAVDYRSLIVKEVS